MTRICSNPIRIALVFLLALSSHSALSQITLPANMYADSAFAPFYWGVASGDPTPDGIVLWTKVPAPEVPVIPIITWEISEDQDFTNLDATGTVEAYFWNDHCMRAEVTGLQPGTTYYYRFTDMSGQPSQVGRTKTAPVGGVDQLKIATASCSSVFSGFFNAYRRISEIDDLDLVVHMGDYIYNTVDSDEEIRIPQPYPTDPNNLQQWRDRHAYYLLDPDLRAARQMHPWINIWDNHDFGDGTEGGFQAFWEYVPRRDPHGDSTLCHRSFQFGGLVDLIMIDIEAYRDIDEFSPGEPSVLGNQQFDWFINELDNSNAQWTIIGNQKMFGGWSSLGIPPGIGIPTDGDVFDDGSWDGYMAERDSVLSFLESTDHDNVMVISGDVHMSFAMDLSRDFLDPEVYDPESGDGSLGVEFISSSVSRGNMDEAGVDPDLIPLAMTVSGTLNPHHQYVNFVDHGYGLITITSDSIMAEYHYCPKLEISEVDSVGKTMVVLDGENRWKRPLDTSISEAENEVNDAFRIYPNPAQEMLRFELPESVRSAVNVRIINVTGKVVKSQGFDSKSENLIDISKLKSGAYIIEAQSNDKIYRKSFVRSE